MSEDAAYQMGYTIGVLVGGLAIGALCGILPLVIGLKRNKRSLAIVSMATCIVGGLILGIFLALPVSIVWTVILLSLKAPQARSNVQPEAQQQQQVAEAPAYEQPQVEQSPAPEQQEVSEAPANEELQTSETPS